MTSLERGAAVARQVLLHRGAVAHAEGRAGDQVEAVCAEARDGDVGLDAALGVAGAACTACADRLVEVGGGDALQRAAARRARRARTWRRSSGRSARRARGSRGARRRRARTSSAGRTTRPVDRLDAAAAQTRSAAPSRSARRRPRAAPSGCRRAASGAARARRGAPRPDSAAGSSRRRLRPRARSARRGLACCGRSGARRTDQRSMPGSPSTIQCAIARPAPPEPAMPAVKPQATKKLSSSGAGPRIGSPSAETGIGPLIRLRTPSSLKIGRRSLRQRRDRSKRSKFDGNSCRAKSAGMPRSPKGDRVRLPAADRQGARLALQVEELVGVAEGRQPGGHAIALLGDQVLVLDHAGRRAPRRPARATSLGPEAGGVHHHVGAPGAVVGDHLGDAPAFDDQLQRRGCSRGSSRRRCARPSRRPGSGCRGRRSRRTGPRPRRPRPRWSSAGTSPAPPSRRDAGAARSRRTRAMVAVRLISCQRSGLDAMRRLPTWCQSTACPVSASSSP